MKILAIHGVGQGDAKAEWKAQWQQAIVRGLDNWRPGLEPVIEFLAYDDLFEKAPLNVGEVREALFRLTASGLFYGLTDRLRSRGGLAAAPVLRTADSARANASPASSPSPSTRSCTAPTPAGATSSRGCCPCRRPREAARHAVALSRT